MQITDVRIKLINQDEKKLRAVASVIIDSAFVVHDIKVIEGSEGCFIVMPSRKAPDGTYRDIAHPLKTEVREYMRDKILEAYEAALKESN
ncbi:MAG: septation regulator SpoVG [Clostridia bacterium]|nr:septation regulator SpoVG [Clostridia bacterium]